ncbi:gliding motility-associated C-terminal domain-containing protein [Sinomicrobium oceani]|nr:gliding motility-associated C-terminal domain-containing protein [Sinomicrobium oceani]
MKTSTAIKIMICTAFIFQVFPVSGQTVNTGTVVIAQGTEVSTMEDFDNKEGATVHNDGTFFVYGNFNNDGLVSFTPGATTGNTLFRGLYGAQNISGNMPSDFFNVLFDNPATQPAFHLSGDIGVYGNAEFRDGIVDGDMYGGLVTFYQGASHQQVSDISFVDGKVRKTGNEPFDYPIGDGGYYRSAYMSEPSELSDHFTSQYILKNSNTLYPHSDKENNIEIIDNGEYWEINRTAGMSDIVLTLTWNEATTPSDILRKEEGKAIHIVRWDAVNKRWKDEGGVTDNEEKTVTTAVSGYGIFTFAKVRTEEEPTGLVIYNGVSPNGDGRNDFFYIKGLENYPENTVEIYNRWGVKVYEAKGYNNTNVRFDGYSHGRATLNKGKLLPTGTYFYILKYNDNNRLRDQSGYLYIN